MRDHEFPSADYANQKQECFRHATEEEIKSVTKKEINFGRATAGTIYTIIKKGYVQITHGNSTISLFGGEIDRIKSEMDNLQER